MTITIDMECTTIVSAVAEDKCGGACDDKHDGFVSIHMVFIASSGGLTNRGISIASRELITV